MKPWERYQSQGSGAKPWEKYAQPAAQAPAVRTGPDPFAGDELLSDEAISKLAAGEESTVAASPEPSGRYLRDVKAAASQVNAAGGLAPVGTLETLGTVASGAVAAPIASVAGMGTEAARGLGLTSAKGEDVAERVQGALTYQPRSASGRAQSGLLGALVRPVSDSGADMALMPLAATPVLRPRGAPLRTPKPDPIPTTKELSTAKQTLYAQAEQAGVVIKPEATARSAGIFREVAEKENLGRLPPKLSEAVTILDERVAGNRPLTLTDADKVRQLINDALRSNDAGDRRLAKIIKSRYDDYLDALGPQDTLAGDTQLAVSILRAARDVNRRFENSRMIDATVRKAERSGDAKYTQAGDEHALRTEFKKIADNEKKMRPLTPEQREAVESVARGGSTAGRRLVTNTARNIGKWDPTTGGMAAFIGPGTGATIGGALGGVAGGGIGALIPPALGLVGKRVATRMTRTNVDRAREALVGRNAVPTAEELGASLRGSGMVRNPIEGELMAREPLALPAPNIIAGSRSAPGTAYAREEMGLTPDVERAGALHPGMARETLTSGAPALPNRAAPAALEDRRPMVIDAQGRTAQNSDELSRYLQESGQEVPSQHPGRAREPEPSRTLALPLLERPPMVVDSAGRVAPTSEKLQEYLRVTGQEGLNNVRQPRAEPVSRPFGLVQAPQSPALTSRGKRRSPGQILREMQRVDAKARKLPKEEPLNSPRMKAIAEEWEHLQLELSLLSPRV